MKVKRFIGKNTHEAMIKVKQELGSNAVILHTRVIAKPRLFGIFKKEEVEIIAAIDEKEILNKKQNVSINSDIKKLQNSVEYIIENLNKSKVDSGVTPKLYKYIDALKKNGVKEEVATSIIENIDKQVNLDSKNDSDIKEIIKYNLKAYLGKPEPIKVTEEQKIVFFIGATGVGKTTTLAKLAAYFTLEKKYKVGLVTADTYRIAAVEQLKTYAEILSLPVEVIYETKGIYETLSKYREKDLVLIDTAGRSHKNKEQMGELKELIYTVKNKEVFLVLNIGTDMDNIKSIIDQYEFIEDYKILFTKLDESEKLGNILNVKFYTDKELSYITNGQNVPEDIQVLDPEKISKMILGDVSYE